MLTTMGGTYVCSKVSPVLITVGGVLSGTVSLMLSTMGDVFLVRCLPW